MAEVRVDDDYRALAASAYVSRVGYAVVRIAGRPTYLHRHIAEQAMGRPLPRGAVVHHVNGSRLDNRRANLVVCADDAHHMAIHARTALVEAGVDPDASKRCCTCQQIKAKAEFSPNWRTWDGRHTQCRQCSRERRRGRGYNKWTPAKAEYQRQYRARKKEAQIAES